MLHTKNFTNVFSKKHISKNTALIKINDKKVPPGIIMLAPMLELVE